MRLPLQIPQVKVDSLVLMIRAEDISNDILL